MESDSKWRQLVISDQSRAQAVRRETKDPGERRWRIFCSKKSVAGRGVLVGEHSIRHRYQHRLIALIATFHR